jgi:FMN phosphatase YigB (HAD superfamily)
MSSQAKAQQKSQTQAGKPTGNVLKDADVFIFDIFGTVVDWRTSVAREIQELGEKYGVGAFIFHAAPELRPDFCYSFLLDSTTVNWTNLAQQWREGYMYNVYVYISSEYQVSA